MKLIKTLRPWLGAAAFFALCGYSYHAFNWSRAWAMASKSTPVASFPARIELGEQERDSTVVVELTFSNPGGGDLLIDQFSSSCSCMGLERKTASGFQPVERLVLEAGHSEHLAARVIVRGAADSTMRSQLRFRTNDPRQPEAVVEMIVNRVLGGLTTTPRQVIFGAIEEGSSVKQLVFVRDRALRERAIRSVDSSNAGHVAVRMLPVAKEADVDGAEGKLIGIIEVTARGRDFGPFEEVIHIWLDEVDRPPERIHVSGRICGPVEVVPSVVVLPRASSQGLVYSGTCAFRSLGTRGFRLVLPATPSGVMIVRETTEDNAAEHVIRIEVTPEFAAESRSVALRFQAVCDGRESPVDLTIFPRRIGAPR